MPLKVREIYFRDQNCLVYTGKLDGLVSGKRQLYRGKVCAIPLFRPNIKVNLRIRGEDDEGHRIEPLMCHARTDGEGVLYIENKYAPVVVVPLDPEEEVDIPVVMPRPTKLALSVNQQCRRKP